MTIALSKQRTVIPSSADDWLHERPSRRALARILGAHDDGLHLIGARNNAVTARSTNESRTTILEWDDESNKRGWMMGLLKRDYRQSGLARNNMIAFDFTRNMDALLFFGRLVVMDFGMVTRYSDSQTRGCCRSFEAAWLVAPGLLYC